MKLEEVDKNLISCMVSRLELEYCKRWGEASPIEVTLAFYKPESPKSWNGFVTQNFEISEEEFQKLQTKMKEMEFRNPISNQQVINTLEWIWLNPDYLYTYAAWWTNEYNISTKDGKRLGRLPLGWLGHFEEKQLRNLGYQVPTGEYFGGCPMKEPCYGC